MRLIDAEKQWRETASDNSNYVLAYADGLFCVTDCYGAVVCEFMPDMSTIDAEPVRHGRFYQTGRSRPHK